MRMEKTFFAFEGVAIGHNTLLTNNSEAYENCQKTFGQKASKSP